MKYLFETSDIKNIYNKKNKDKYNGNYEYSRWIKSDIDRAAYRMTYKSIRQRLDEIPVHPSRILEVGPGPGTWTKLLVSKFPHARIDVVDISSEMLHQARESLQACHGVYFFESDFLAFHGGPSYDFFFASRVFEYFPDKGKAVQKIALLVSPGKKVMLITKTPHYRRLKLLGKSLTAMHQGQIAPHALVNLFFAHGFSDIHIFPVTISIPLFHSARLNLFFYRLCSRFRLRWWNKAISESYILVATKL
ncbi:MAG TPA: hypothetical protein DCY48_04640 [Candidatus Magasanikbacteria bacterium]|nr:MAG: hypothetical protein A3I74_03130 [Candidatus Magasanikbacteria bacterium RIFCSPLOWO2_02_FULL_47_16]OGH80205.1 MAG: hypothetical protein A3C10_03410 [Candidatus Magasanikbacteria bacterium RIFCSPHIGHO2_02_FULL_48_18]HAZ29029.1 hypothetical protein [Candidatus Magasanikbacteria bacterium]